MALSQRLDLRQSQSLVMTPQLQQAIKLLQLSNLELTSYVEEELERNPLLRSDEDTEGGGEDRRRTDKTDDTTAPQPVNGEATAIDTLNLVAGEGIAKADEASLDTDYENLWNGGADFTPAPQPGPMRGVAASGTDASIIEQTVAAEISLFQHLSDQISADFDNPSEGLIAIQLAGLLDDSGYLAGDLDPVAEQIGCQRQVLDEIIERLKQLDPAGVFAADLSECLALQLRERDRLDPAMQTLLDNLDLVARRDKAKLKQACNVDDEDLAEMMAELRRLDPKPAQAFSHALAQPVTPDVLVRQDGSGGWAIELNAETLPKVLVDRTYYANVGKRIRCTKDKAYLNERLQEANWLVRALHQRATTILKVSSEIIRQQDGFMRHGVQHLKPLVLRDIASVIEMHESTVSRVTNNKYMATPRGIFELKYFFTAAISATGGGEELSAEAVRHRIKALIDAEPADKVLSDDTIVGALAREGIDIARRTVAKYREALRIPSSVERRRIKADAV
ncbi:MAG: RNA polymerase factor sigma-54 [Alphaproteobacteria bacterium]|nr:RNA polymerase factor sigma-54 [Alphaproteobacteria bacterium]